MKELLQWLISVWDDAKPIVFIKQYSQAVVYRAGKYVKNWGPGWHGRISFLDEYHEDNVMLDTMEIKEVNITTLDGKTSTNGCEFDLRIKDIKKALIDTNDWRSNLQAVARGVMSSELEDRNWDDIRKKTTKNAIEKEIQKRAHEMGIEIYNFNFTDKALTRAYKLFNT